MAPLNSWPGNSHLHRIRELNATPAGDDATSHLVRDYTVAHLEADLRWLGTAMERITEQKKSRR